MKASVSIIVPVYQAEAYIARCIQSILAQVYPAYELILIDDGCTDASGRICDEYAYKDDRIRVIHQENRGAAAARNAGLDAAQGQYVMFCDADDVVSPMWVKRLMELRDDERLVQPIGAYCSKHSELGQCKELEIAKQKPYCRDDYYALNLSGLAGYLWNALYRMDVIREHGLRIRSRRGQGDYNEDLLFALEYASHMEGFVYSGYADYCYDRREGSLSTSYQQLYFAKYEEKYSLWRAFILKHGKREDEKRLATEMLYHFLRAMQMECDQADIRSFGRNYRRFSNIVLSQSLQQCVMQADLSKENPRIIHLIQKKNTIALWLMYLLRRMKRRIGL